MCARAGVESQRIVLRGAVGAGWRLGLHVVEIVDEMVIWDQLGFNGLTFLVDNRVKCLEWHKGKIP